MSPEWQPIRFAPVYQDYIWGGDRIRTVFGRSGAGPTCAESWEISDRDEGPSIAESGAYAGRSLRDLALQLGPGLLGRAARSRRFPLLIKIIDARERLSLQVHPDDASADRAGGEAKTEMWYALPGAPGAYVYAGLKPGVDRASFEAALGAGRVERLLRREPVRAGQAVFIPGGRVHAIGEGCLLLEVQQNSNTTYRVSDWGRVDRSGRPRPTHLRQALEVIRWHDDAPCRIPAPPASERRARVFQCPHFRLERLRPDGAMRLRNGGASFHVLFVASGRVRLTAAGFAEDAGPGQSYLLPAALSAYAVEPVGPRSEVLRISVPGLR